MKCNKIKFVNHKKRVILLSYCNLLSLTCIFPLFFSTLM